MVLVVDTDTVDVSEGGQTYVGEAGVMVIVEFDAMEVDPL